MNVNFEKTDEVNGVLTVAFVEDDYKAEVKKELNRLGMARPIKGFRPGHVPAALLQKFYGPQVKAQIVDRMLNKAVGEYLVNNHIAILGSPLMVDDDINIDSQADFEFKLDLALAPEFELNVDKNITIPYYNITVTDEMVQRQNEGYRKRFGKQVPGEEAAIDSIVRGSLVELDENGQVKAEGISAERTMIMPQRLTNEEQQQRFVGAKVGQEIVFNPHTACDGNAGEMASILNVERDEAEKVTSDFKMTVDEVMVNQIADMDQEFFDNVLGKDEAKTEDEYMAKLREVIAHELMADSNYRFTIDAEQVLRDRVGELAMPDDLLKRMLLREEKNTAEDVEKNYPQARAQLQWQIIKNRAAESLKVSVDDNDRRRLAKLMAAQQFAQYGMTNLPDDVVDNYAQKLMNDERYSEEIANRAFDDKFFAALKDAVTLQETEISIDEFNKLFEKKEA